MSDSSARPKVLRPRFGLCLAVVACAAIAAVVLMGGDEDAIDRSADAGPDTGVQDELTLSTGGLNNSAATCPMVDATTIGAASIAFKGTVVLSEDGVAQLAVDEDYIGVGAPTVKLVAPPGVDAWLGPISWTVGTQYLVTANSGVVNFCGRSGRATTKLQDVFDQAFRSLTP